MQVQKPRQGYKLVTSLFGKHEEIPEDWDFVKILDNSTLKGRIGWQGLTTAEYRQKGEFYLVTGTDFKNGKIDWKNCVYVDEERYAQDTNIQLKKGDVLVTKDGTIGKIAYIDILSLPTTLNSGVFVIRPKDKSYFPLFLYYILYSDYFMKFLNKLKAGSTINHLYQKDFVNFHFPIPPYHEQQKIASILSNVDSLINQTQKIIEQTQGLKKGLMQRLLTKGIGHTKFKKIKIGNNPYQLLTIPDSWNYLQLGDTGDFINGLNKQKEDYGHGCLHVNIDNIFESFTIQLEKLGRVNATEKEIERYRLEKNDVCLLRSSVKRDGIGYPALFLGSTEPVVFSGFIIRFRPDTKIWNATFLTHLLRSEFIRQNVIAWATVSANININQESYKKIPVPHPSVKEQQEITLILSNMDSQIQKQQDYKSKLETLKKGLMQKLLTGQIRVKV